MNNDWIPFTLITSKTVKLFFSIIIPLIVVSLPKETIPLTGISITEQRMLGVFFMATLFWILEPVPVFATSILIIVIELLYLSDQAIVFFRPLEVSRDFGLLLPYKEVMGVFASPIILLFIGGFFLANAAKKYRLDAALTNLLLKPFGTAPSSVILGIMLLTAFFSMFMSNTATTAMMLSLVFPLLVHFKNDETGKVCLILSVPFAANIGGLGTPIGTPPNAIALKYLTGTNTISFGSWMTFGVPYVLIMIFFVWQLLLKLFPIKTKEIKLAVPQKTTTSWQGWIVYGTFALTIVLWVTDKIHMVNAYVVAMIPVAIFTLTGIMTAEDLKKISWDVLWLVAGGLALGMGLEKTGLSATLVNNIPFNSIPVLCTVVIISVAAIIMATFMSNTATANLLLPIVAALGATMPSLAPFGGTKMIILSTAFSCSLAMALPVSTPPNAIAYASGVIKTKNLIKGGIIIGITGLFGVYFMLFLLKELHFLL